MAKAIKKSPGKSPTRSPSNALGTDQSLQHFDLIELQQYTKEKIYSTDASKDFHLFYVGRDDVHDILKYVLSRVIVSQSLAKAQPKSQQKVPIGTPAKLGGK